MAGKVAYQLPTWVPDDLVYDIFCRLPVQSLVRFKGLNKSCFNMIEDPNFISRHLHIFNRNSDIRLLLIHTTFVREFISLLSFNSETNTCSLNLFDLNDRGFQILGPCNGIYCLLPYNYDSILFINPAMRELVTLPNYYDRIPLGITWTTFSAGFGFDPKTNDYKVVKIIKEWAKYPFSEPLGWHAEIYTLSSKSWRKVTSPLLSLINTFPSNTTGPMFVQGATHWLIERDSYVILAFDMVDDVFKVINVKIETNKCGPLTITKFKESLALIYDKLGWFELWVMEEYGKEGSWTKHLIIEHNRELERPLVFCEDGRCLLCADENESLMCYDLKTQEVINLGYQEEWHSIEGALYEESLISLRRASEPSEALVSAFDMVPQPLFDDNSA